MEEEISVKISSKVLKDPIEFSSIVGNEAIAVKSQIEAVGFLKFIKDFLNIKIFLDFSELVLEIFENLAILARMYFFIWM